MFRCCHDRRWSCYDLNTEHGPPDPSLEGVVKSLHHRPGTRVQKNTFIAINCTQLNGVRRDSRLGGSRQNRVCTQLVLRIRLKRCFFGVQSFRYFWFRFIQVPSKFRVTRFNLSLRSILRQIQFCWLLCRSVMRGSLIHWRLLQIVSGSSLTLTGVRHGASSSDSEKFGSIPWISNKSFFRVAISHLDLWTRVGVLCVDELFCWLTLTYGCWQFSSS